ncbi:hypothetical protein V8V91_16805 [Algoriphagus halophilus]|uniref:hypothetical protein n=1 Tax=Algoriphagus halophilus TaxID=226505 RepID=UPI00358E9AC4
MKNNLRPPKCNYGNKSISWFFVLILNLIFFSCTQEQDPVISQDELQTIRNFIDLEVAGKTTFDNLPIELDWKKAKLGDDFMEIPLINPIRSFETVLDYFQTRLVISNSDLNAYKFISLESNFDHSHDLFTTLISERKEGNWVRWMQIDNNLRSLEVSSYRTITDPKANMPLDCVTVTYMERTCFYEGFSLISCTDWETVSQYEVCGSEGEGGGGGGSTNYKEDVIIKDSSFVGTKADCIFEKLLDTSEGFQKMIQEFDGSFSVANLIFAMDNLGSTRRGETSPPENFNITNTINNNSTNSGASYRPNLLTAKTIIHEVIHAEMFRKLLSLASTNGNIITSILSSMLENGDYPGMLDYYTRYGLNGFQHQQMAAHYRETIARMLQEFQTGLVVPSSQMPSSLYMDLAWEGLNHSTNTAWQTAIS